MNQEEHTILIAKFKTATLKSSLCDYSDAYILDKGNITVNNTQLMVLLQIILIKIVLHLLTA